MAFAKKCDRCSKLYEEYNTKQDSTKFNGITTLNLDHHGKYYTNAPLDLCPECKGSFDQWLFAGKSAGEIRKENKK